MKILEGDCIEQMRGLDDNSVDSIVCDPPYHLTTGKKGGSGPASVTLENPYGRSRIGTGFMGMTWDGGDIAFRTEVWAEALRVLKPGGHLLAFSGSRTYHRMVVAIEDAGFEIRDQIMWIYGSGFPKSHDVSKGIDKAGGISPYTQSQLLRTKREAANLTREQLAERIGCTESSVRDWEEGRARSTGAAIEHIIPRDDYRERLAAILGYSSDERKIVGLSKNRLGDDTIIGLGHTGVIREGGVTNEAQQWQGWGTALKPAHEPICLARKPLIGTVARNVLEHGTGAINIDGCRIETTDAYSYPNGPGGCKGGEFHYQGRANTPAESNPLGRWPANIIHDGSDEVLAGFPETGPSSAAIRNNSGEFKSVAKGRDLPHQTSGYADDGSAARFFYQAKANKKERRGSSHPTVKPIALMRYLCRLITPPGGTILDPFAGTGTTGEAAVLEGFFPILIEREPQYVADIHKRMNEVMSEIGEDARSPKAA